MTAVDHWPALCPGDRAAPAALRRGVDQFCGGYIRCKPLTDQREGGFSEADKRFNTVREGVLGDQVAAIRHVLIKAFGRCWDDARMDGMEAIVAALASGVATGATETAGTAAGRALGSLRHLLRQRLTDGRGAALLNATVDDPVLLADGLAADLVDTGADRDPEILAAAREVLRLAGEPRPPGVTMADNYGAAGNFAGPVTINVGSLPPSSPEPH